MQANVCVLIDRDGTLNVDRCYLADADELELFPGAARALVRLKHLGCKLVVVTNQSGVARGFITPEQLAEVHRRLGELLDCEGAQLDRIYTCTHRDEDGCACRKPKCGLVERAARELDFDPRQAYMVGDKACDVLLGQAVGAYTILVRTGNGRDTEADRSIQPDAVADDLAAAADLIETRLRASAGDRGAEPAN